MRTFRHVLIAFVAIIASLFSNASRAETTAPVARPRLLVVPFANHAGPTLGYLSFQYAENLAAIFENEPGVTVLNGQFPLMTEAQAKVLDASEGYLPAACTLAKKRGADLLLTGVITGRSRLPKPSTDGDLSVRVEIRDVSSCDASAPRGLGELRGNQLIPMKRKNGSNTAIVSSEKLQKLLADTTLLAFTRAQIQLAPETIKTLGIAPTADSYANILMGRAVDRYLRPLDLAHHRAPAEAALDFAQKAINVDPKFVEARRFYAFLLETKLGTDGKPQLVKARVHYEMVLKARPHDVRSLIRLGHIEFEGNHLDVAKAYLTQAATARPQDAEPHFWLGESLLKLGDVEAATAAFEKVRALEPDGLRARRRLAELYTTDEKHLAAAKELKVIVAAEPDNVGAIFEEAACLRQADKETEALAVYDAAAERFPNEKRFKRFAGYLRDPQEPEGPAVGDFLISTTINGLRAASFTELLRVGYQRAGNDAVLDLAINKKEACKEDRGAASAVAAKDAKETFLAKRDVLKAAATLIETARKNGEWLFLTSDLRVKAQKVLDASARTESDVREMNAQLNGPVARLVRANGCDESELTATEPEVIAERNALREVTLPKVNPPTSVLKITPEVRAMAAKTSEFAVDNTQGSEAYEVIVDGESVGTVEPGSKLSHLTIAAGYHNICFRGLDKDCRVGSDRGRNVPFHDGLRILIRRGAGPELIVPEGEG